MNQAGPYRIVVVEDDIWVAREICRIVKEMGHEVVAEVSNGEDAVKITCAKKPDLVLMDVEMSGQDGIEASKIIQDICPTSVVILTAYESSDLLERASAVGVSAYLVKPARAQDIERAIFFAVARHNDMMELTWLNNELEEKNAELQSALSEIKTLRGILPICSFCKKIRDKEGNWIDVDHYIDKHSDANMSHGICAECLAENYPDCI